MPNIKMTFPAHGSHVQYSYVKRTVFILLLLFSLNNSFAQNSESSKILGTYFTENNKAKVSITQNGNKYIGTLIWTNIPDAVDKNNPDKNLRQTKLVGKVILKDLEYDGDNQWKKGKIYDPESGKTYSCTVTLDKKGNLKVRGFVGVSLLGRTTVWTKTR